MQFKLDNNDFISLTIVRKSKMKHIYLRVTPEGVVVSANRKTDLADIEAFVYSKSTWLRKHLKVQEAQSKKRLFITGNKVYYQGEPILLECKEHELSKITLELIDNKFLVFMPKETSQKELESLFDQFYKNRAMVEITPLIDKWSKTMNLKPSNIGFRKAKKRWGSCSSQNSLSFNFYLIKLPLDIVEYVVVHELAHIEQKNHSKDFWALIEEFLPNYKRLIEELREFESII